MGKNPTKQPTPSGGNSPHGTARNSISGRVQRSKNNRNVTYSGMGRGGSAGCGLKQKPNPY